MARSETPKGISQKVKRGASPAEQKMLAVAVQTMRTSEGFMPTYLPIRASIVVRQTFAAWNLIMYAETK